MTVTGLVKDKSGFAWPFAVLQFTVSVPSGQKPVDTQSGQVINMQPIICDATGSFTASLQQTALIVPGSLWQLTIYPFNNQRSGQTLEPFSVGSTALDLSSQIAAQLVPYVDPPLIVPMSNSGTVGQSPLNGSIYYDVKAPGLFLRDPAANAFIEIASIPPTQIVAYLENTATASPKVKIISGLGTLLSGGFTQTFTSPFAPSTFPAVLFSVIKAGGAPGDLAPTLFLVSLTNSAFTVFASSLTSTDPVRWVAIGVGP